MLLLLSGPAAAPAPTPTPAPVTTQAGSPMWGPWKPIRVRQLVRGSAVVRLIPPTVSATGTVLENEDWLLGLPTESDLLN